MESGAKGCEVIVSGKLRAQRAKAMKFKDGFMVSSGEPVRQYIDSAVRHVMLRQGVLGIKVCSPISHVHLRGLLLTTIVAKCSLSYLMYQRLVTAESVPLDGSSGSPLTASDDAETVPNGAPVMCLSVKPTSMSFALTQVGGRCR